MSKESECEYEKRSIDKENKLKPLLTDEFLETLSEAVKVCGWSVDHVESSDFVRWCFNIVGKDKPDTEPYDYGSET